MHVQKKGRKKTFVDCHIVLLFESNHKNDVFLLLGDHYTKNKTQQQWGQGANPLLLAFSSVSGVKYSLSSFFTRWIWHSCFISAKWCTIISDFFPKYPGKVTHFHLFWLRKDLQSKSLIFYIELRSFLILTFYKFIEDPRFYRIIRILVCFPIQTFQQMENAYSFLGLLIRMTC